MEQQTISPKFKQWLAEAADLEMTGETQLQDPKRQLYMKMAQELLTYNVPSYQIYSRIHKDLQAELRIKKDNPKYTLNSSWLYEVCQSNGWTTTSVTKIPESSLLEKDVPFKVLRNKMILICEEMKKQLSSDIELIEDSDNKISKESWNKFFIEESEKRDFLEEMYGIIIAHFEDANRLRDSRQIILPTERFVITAMNFYLWDSWYCKLYHSKVKDHHGKEDITPKKLSLFRKDSLSKSHLVYHTMVDPLNFHFLGIKCPGCGSTKSLKTVWNMNGTWEIVCINEAAHNDKKPRFSHELLADYIEQLSHNTDGAATSLLISRGFKDVTEESKNLR